MQTRSLRAQRIGLGGLLRKPFLFLILFFYIYSPPISGLPFGPAIPVAAFSWLYLMVRGRHRLTQFLGQTKLRLAVWLTVLAFLLSLVYETTNSELALRTAYGVALFLIEVIPCSLLVVDLVEESPGSSENRLLAWLALLGAAQGFLSAFLFMNPDLNYKINAEWLRHASGNPTLSIFRYDYQLYRGFGVGSSYFFALPVFQSISALCCLKLGLDGQSKYLLLLPVIVLAIVFNARIGLVTMALGFLVMTAHAALNVGRWPVLKYLIVVPLVGLSSYALLSAELGSTASRLHRTEDWIQSAPDEGIIETIGEMALFLPEDLFFGDQVDVFMGETPSGGSADAGFTQSLFFGGLLFAGFLYGAWVSLGIAAFDGCRSGTGRWFLVASVLIAVVANTKGHLVGSANEASRGLALVWVGYALWGSSPRNVIGRK